MIRDFWFDGANYQFISPHTPPFTNGSSYTVIVGRNGTGKSRLLREVAKESVPLAESEFIGNDEYTPRHFHHDRIGRDNAPRQVICVSTSPFDKFPLPKVGNSTNRYVYLGLRGIPSQNLGLAYMAKLFGVLLPSIHSNPDQGRIVSRVLEYLGYEPYLEVSFASTISTSALREIDKGDDSDKVLSDLLEKIEKKNTNMTDGGYSSSRLKYSAAIDSRAVLNKLLEFESIAPRGRIEMTFRGTQISAPQGNMVTDAAVELIASGYLRLRSVSLKKIGISTPYKISDASSGEQSVLLTMLGIASYIKPHSLICIDEPEVCLHPEWQQRYITLLMQLFDGISNCQFLIASHSPMIVSELSQTNCYVLSMEDRQLVSARELSHKSADFQLAEVFRIPGHSNEYLVRLALNTLVLVARERRFSEQDRQALRTLRNLAAQLDVNDPVIELLHSLEEMAIAYG